MNKFLSFDFRPSIILNYIILYLNFKKTFEKKFSIYSITLIDHAFFWLFI